MPFWVRSQDANRLPLFMAGLDCDQIGNKFIIKDRQSSRKDVIIFVDKKWSKILNTIGG